MQNSAQPPDLPQRRTVFLDNLKVLLIVLVIFHHAGQPYGPTGGAWPVDHAEKYRWLGMFFHINASFFMGLLFLISGYFVASAYDRKGPRLFLIDRVRRFGVPILLFGWAFVPFIRHVMEGRAWSEAFLPFEWAHLWFLGHLLIYAVGYVIFRQFRTRTLTHAQVGRPFPGQGVLLGYALMLGVTSAVVRIWFPTDVWIRLGVVAEIAHLPQYVSLFIFGVVCGPRRWLERIPAQTGFAWLVVALLMIVLRYLYSLLLPAFMMEDDFWIDLLWNLWEAFLCVGLSIGLVWLFQRTVARDSTVRHLASRYAFSVYVVHLPVVVFLQIGVERFPLPPLALTLIVGGAGLILSYLLAIAFAPSYVVHRFRLALFAHRGHHVRPPPSDRKARASSGPVG